MKYSVVPGPDQQVWLNTLMAIGCLPLLPSLRDSVSIRRSRCSTSPGIALGRQGHGRCPASDIRRMKRATMGEAGGRQRHVAGALRANRGLRTLDVRSCSICDEGVGHFLEALQVNSTLTALHFAPISATCHTARYTTTAIPFQVF